MDGREAFPKTIARQSESEFKVVLEVDVNAHEHRCGAQDAKHIPEGQISEEAADVRKTCRKREQGNDKACEKRRRENDGDCERPEPFVPESGNGIKNAN